MWRVTKEDPKYWNLLSDDLRHKIDQKVIDRFFSRFEQGEKEKCWEWQGGQGNNGYGRLKINKKNFKAHRISFALFNGYLDSSKVCCHSCDNPVCVNPHHLWLGTHLENMKDRDKKGRCKSDHLFTQTLKTRKLTQEDVIWMRANYSPNTWSVNKLAKKFQVCRNTIQQALKGKTWKSINHENVANPSNPPL